MYIISTYSVWWHKVELDQVQRYSLRLEIFYYQAQHTKEKFFKYQAQKFTFTKHKFFKHQAQP